MRETDEIIRKNPQLGQRKDVFIPYDDVILINIASNAPPRTIYPQSPSRGSFR
jgi:hypothetical protein